MKHTASYTEDQINMEIDLHKFLSVYTTVGIASRDRFEDAPHDFHPKNIIADFESIIAFGQGGGNAPQKSEMGSFHNLFECIAAQDAVIQYLQAHGFTADLIKPITLAVSLPRIGEQAGIGEISGVNSLVVEGDGLATSLGAIITNAPLVPNKLLKNVCTECWACVDACPATDEPFDMNPSRCTACGECVKACPV